jgi:hypothetical protein
MINDNPFSEEEMEIIAVELAIHDFCELAEVVQGCHASHPRVVERNRDELTKSAMAILEFLGEVH